VDTSHVDDRSEGRAGVAAQILTSRAATLAPLLVMSVMIAASASAQSDYPVKPIRFIVASPPGGPADFVARVIGPRLNTALGQSVVVDNRGGASGIIGTDMVAKAVPDGHTLLLANAGLAINPSLFGRVPYDPVRDLAPVTQAISVSNTLVVHPSVAAKSVQELVALAKARPGQLTFASAGNGTSGHLAAELLKLMAGVNMTHVPYKGGGPALAELIGGQVNVLFSITLVAMPHVKSGRIRALAVTSGHRLAIVPELPTIAESGYPGYEVSGWFGVLVPARTSTAIVNRLHKEIVAGLNLAESRERLAGQGAEVVASTPAQFSEYIKSEMAKWSKVVREARIKVE
jgi:tripartite-type tricarboxylate transporter receptor subunit TctC